MTEGAACANLFPLAPGCSPRSKQAAEMGFDSVTDRAMRATGTAVSWYGLATASVAAGTLATLGLSAVTRGRPTVFALYAAIFASAWYGGSAAGWLAVILSTLAVDCFFLEPVYSLRLAVEDLPYLVTFIICAGFANAIAARQRRATEALQRANRALQAESAAREREQAALQAARDELARITRITTVGEFAASIAHEINQPLAAIVTSGNACQRWLARGPENLVKAEQAVDRMIGDAYRANEIISRIRSLTRKAAPEQVELNINDIIADVLAFTRDNLAAHRIEVTTELVAALPAIRGDRVQLQQVLLNLVINGIEAMSAVDHRRLLSLRSGLDEAGEVVVTVQDSGVGLDPDTAPRIFDAFFTTKSNGMGMGLSISASIVEAHGGRLRATPADPNGTAFHFTLPAVRESAPCAR